MHTSVQQEINQRGDHHYSHLHGNNRTLKQIQNQLNSIKQKEKIKEREEHERTIPSQERNRHQDSWHTERVANITMPPIDNKKEEEDNNERQFSQRNQIDEDEDVSEIENKNINKSIRQTKVSVETSTSPQSDRVFTSLFNEAKKNIEKIGWHNEEREEREEKGQERLTDTLRRLEYQKQTYVLNSTDQSNPDAIHQHMQNVKAESERHQQANCALLQCV